MIQTYRHTHTYRDGAEYGMIAITIGNGPLVSTYIHVLKDGTSDSRVQDNKTVGMTIK